MITQLFLRAIVGFVFPHMADIPRWSRTTRSQCWWVVLRCCSDSHWLDSLSVHYQISLTRCWWVIEVVARTHTRATWCKNRRPVYIYSYPCRKARLLFRQSVNYCSLNDSSVIQCSTSAWISATLLPFLINNNNKKKDWLLLLGMYQRLVKWDADASDPGGCLWR